MTFSVCCHPEILLTRQRDVTTSPLYFPKHRKPSSSWKVFIRHKCPSSRALMYVTNVLNCCDTYYNALTMVFWAIDFTVLSYHNFVTWGTAPTRVLFVVFFCDLGIDNKLSQVNALSSKPITPIVWGKNVPSCKRLDHRITWMTTLNWPLPSSKNPHFQNEAKYTTFLVEMSFICMRMKNHFHIKGWALNLVLIQRLGETRKWPIAVPASIGNVKIAFPISTFMLNTLT